MVHQCSQWKTKKIIYLDDGHLDWLQRLHNNNNSLFLVVFGEGCLDSPLLGLVCRAGGVAISSPCLVWEWSFSSVLFLEPHFFFLLLPLVILETLFCGRKQFSAAVLSQDKYWSLTIMQQPSPWDALLEDRLTMQDRSRRNRFDQTAWQNQAQYSFQILMTN